MSNKFVCLIRCIDRNNLTCSILLLIDFPLKCRKEFFKFYSKIQSIIQFGSGFFLRYIIQSGLFNAKFYSNIHIYNLYANILLVTISLNEPELNCLQTVKWFQVLLSIINNSICTQLNSFQYCYFTPIHYLFV